MTPQEKALELAIKFCSSEDVVRPNLRSIKTAIICVEELINVTTNDELKRPRTPRDRQYWQSVKQELLKIK